MFFFWLEAPKEMDFGCLASDIDLTCNPSSAIL